MRNPSKVPVLLSAFVCPGIGQYLQKRFVAGLIYGASFITGFCWLMIIAGQIIYSYYRLAFAPGHSPEEPNILSMLPPALLSIVLYIVNLFDVTIAQQRITRKRREEEFRSEVN